MADTVKGYTYRLDGNLRILEWTGGQPSNINAEKLSNVEFVINGEKVILPGDINALRETMSKGNCSIGLDFYPDEVGVPNRATWNKFRDMFLDKIKDKEVPVAGETRKLTKAEFDTIKALGLRQGRDIREFRGAVKGLGFRFSDTGDLQFNGGELWAKETGDTIVVVRMDPAGSGGWAPPRAVGPKTDREGKVAAWADESDQLKLPISGESQAPRHGHTHIEVIPKSLMKDGNYDPIKDSGKVGKFSDLGEGVIEAVSNKYQTHAASRPPYAVSEWIPENGRISLQKFRDVVTKANNELAFWANKPQFAPAEAEIVACKRIKHLAQAVIDLAGDVKDIPAKPMTQILTELQTSSLAGRTIPELGDRTIAQIAREQLALMGHTKAGLLAVDTLEPISSFGRIFLDGIPKPLTLRQAKMLLEWMHTYGPKKHLTNGLVETKLKQMGIIKGRMSAKTAELFETTCKFINAGGKLSTTGLDVMESGGRAMVVSQATNLHKAWEALAAYFETLQASGQKLTVEALIAKMSSLGFPTQNMTAAQKDILLDFVEKYNVRRMSLPKMPKPDPKAYFRAPTPKLLPDRNSIAGGKVSPWAILLGIVLEISIGYWFAYEEAMEDARRMAEFAFRGAMERARWKSKFLEAMSGAYIKTYEKAKDRLEYILMDYRDYGETKMPWPSLEKMEHEGSPYGRGFIIEKDQIKRILKFLKDWPDDYQSQVMVRLACARIECLNDIYYLADRSTADAKKLGQEIAKELIKFIEAAELINKATCAWNKIFLIPGR